MRNFPRGVVKDVAEPTTGDVDAHGALGDARCAPDSLWDEVFADVVLPEEPQIHPDEVESDVFGFGPATFD